MTDAANISQTNAFSMSTGASETSISARRKVPRLSNSSQKGQAVHSLNPHDVVLGRGQHVKHDGNTLFLNLVRSRAAEYHACANKTSKDVVARKIVRIVENSGGRFVRRIESSGDASTELTSAWEIVDQSTVLVKVKQTFRDYSVVRRKAAASASSLPETPDMDAPPLQPAARPSDGEVSLQLPSFSNSSAVTFVQPGAMYTDQNVYTQQGLGNAGLLLAVLSNQALQQQSLGTTATISLPGMPQHLVAAPLQLAAQNRGEALLQPSSLSNIPVTALDHPIALPTNHNLASQPNSLQSSGNASIAGTASARPVDATFPYLNHATPVVPSGTAAESIVCILGGNDSHHRLNQMLQDFAQQERQRQWQAFLLERIITTDSPRFTGELSSSLVPPSAAPIAPFVSIPQSLLGASSIGGINGAHSSVVPALWSSTMLSPLLPDQLEHTHPHP
jgi:hypothetical protein